MDYQGSPTWEFLTKNPSGPFSRQNCLTFHGWKWGRTAHLKPRPYLRMEAIAGCGWQRELAHFFWGYISKMKTPQTQQSYHWAFIPLIIDICTPYNKDTPRRHLMGQKLETTSITVQCQWPVSPMPVSVQNATEDSFGPSILKNTIQQWMRAWSWFTHASM